MEINLRLIFSLKWGPLHSGNLAYVRRIVGWKSRYTPTAGGPETRLCQVMGTLALP